MWYIPHAPILHMRFQKMLHRSSSNRNQLLHNVISRRMLNFVRVTIDSPSPVVFSSTRHIISSLSSPCFNFTLLALVNRREYISQCWYIIILKLYKCKTYVYICNVRNLIIFKYIYIYICICIYIRIYSYTYTYIYTYIYIYIFLYT